MKALTKEYKEAWAILALCPIFRKMRTVDRLNAVRHLAGLLFVGGKYPLTVNN